MSSAAYFKPKRVVRIADWMQFCAENEILYSPNTVGGNVFYHGAVEITFGPNTGTVGRTKDGKKVWSTALPPAKATEITVSTFFGGSAMADVARIARLARERFDGRLTGSPEIEKFWHA